MKEYGKNTLGQNVQIFDPVTLGFPSRECLNRTGYPVQ